MTADPRSIERAKADFFATLATHFDDLSPLAGVPVDPRRVTAIWEQGLFVAGAGARAAPAKQGVHPVGLIRISTPRNLALRTQEDRDVGPGDYSILVYADGSVHLREVGGSSAIPVAAPGTLMKDSGGGGGPGTCSSALQLEFQYKNCELCITLICPGQWVVLLWCFKIPFCDFLTGLLQTF
jgi:hypothetical protein